MSRLMGTSGQGASLSDREVWGGSSRDEGQPQPLAGRPEMSEGLWPPHSENLRLSPLPRLAVREPALFSHHVPSPEP